VLKDRDHFSATSSEASGPKGQAVGTGTKASRGDGLSPIISLPKGGGAIKGIGEKFAANPVTGTGTMTIPLATSPGRSGFGPQLNLSYDSGSGNGVFGFGWSLSLPAITRKTEKGLPQYFDGDESDVFILSGSEDLVPFLVETATGWLPETLPTRNLDGEDYQVRRYRPRIEGLFSRIERWTSLQTGDIHWRSITRDNITTLYGKDDKSRIFAPAGANTGQPKRVFSWLICQSYDDKGNAVVYEHVAENDQGVDRGAVNERNRVRDANRYLRSIKYGNRVSRLIQPNLDEAEWMFEVVFDYNEGRYEELPLNPALSEPEQHRFVRASLTPALPWIPRPDPFSVHRSGFEVRTYRRCHRVLMFHRFPELGAEACLVRSTQFEYADLDYSLPTTIDQELAHQGSTRFASFIQGVTQSGFVRDASRPVVAINGVNFVTYLKKSLPPLEFEYSKAKIQDEIRELDTSSVENLPVGLDGSSYQWVDLDGEGVTGILTEQANAWFYKPNLGEGRFGRLEVVAPKPSLADLSSGRQQLLDLAGDGQLDLVAFAGPSPGFYERTRDENWEQFKAFSKLPSIRWDEPNLRFVDLNGDGHADILIAENEVFTWYPSLAEAGFDSARSVHQPFDEEKGPRLLLADGTQSIYLADMCGDGLTDLVRIRNNDVCYWPNLGHGRFGARVAMENAPWFDNLDQFDHRRIRLTDIDGSGTNDIVYLGRDGVHLYFNQSGNRWSEPRRLGKFPRVDNLSSVMTADLLGNGTACLVWSSPLPADIVSPLRYIDLMGGQKPHLMIKSVNNLGAETHFHYVASTKFYLADKLARRPWITKIPFPVHVVERTETYDRISGNRFVTRSAYHHGYFDGVEREFRGFGMVEQWDTEEFAALNAGEQFPPGTNVEESSHVPPVLSRTWFHTGAYLGRDHVSDFFAGLLDGGDAGEYYREPGLTHAQTRELLLDDTVLPTGLTIEEEREACRALKGLMLRQEVYALDGTDKEQHPYAVTEQNFTIRQLQPHAGNRHAVFFTHARESISYNYERNPNDPRISHALTLEVDEFGNVLKSAAIGYGRRQTIRIVDAQGVVQEIPNEALNQLDPGDQEKQTLNIVTYTENGVTNPIDDVAVDPANYRAPLLCDSRTYELTGYTPTGAGGRFHSADFVQVAGEGLTQLFDTEIDYEDPPTNGKQRRLIEQVRTLYRKNDLTDLLALGTVESLVLPGESYKLAFTPGLAQQIYVDSGKLSTVEQNNVLANEGGYVHSEGDGNWWIPSGRIFFSPGSSETPAQEFAHARQHFFLPRRYRDPFHTSAVSTESFVDYDDYDLLILETRDALGNRVTAGERDLADTLAAPGNDYRVLQPRLVMDPNRGRTQVAFDMLGMVVGTAVMGKPGESLGDSLAGFEADLVEAVVLDHLANPLGNPQNTLQRATKRLIYDLFAYCNTKDQPEPQPAVVYTMARETHDGDPVPAGGLKIQHSFSYSDGFGREIQTKIQAEPGSVPQRDAEGQIIVGANGQPEMTPNDASPRWVGSGWTIFNNKGKPIRQYEPFFTDTHGFEFDVRIGVSSVIFYDAVKRVVATLHPNHTWEKVIFDPWQQSTWDVNDVVLVADPKIDPDVGDFFSRLPETEYLPTWHAQREGGALGPQEQAAARKSAIHAATPTVAHTDSLGRPFLNVAHNKLKYSDTPPAAPAVEEFYRTRIILDIEGNPREVIDAKDCVVVRYEYDMLGTRIHHASMEAGERWMLDDIAGNPLYAWDSRTHRFRAVYDPLRRPTDSFLREGTGAELLVRRTVYGEALPDPEANNLRTQPVQLFDQAGVVTSDEYDFKGNPLRSQRQLAQNYKTTLDWSVATPLEATIYTSRTGYDALNRPTELTAPDNSIIHPIYNEANLLERIEANLRGEPTVIPFVTDIDYDATGQRTLIEYGNGVRTTDQYDPLTFRLVHRLTRRNPIDFPDDCPQPPPIGWPGCQVQDLHYTYDPAGNITHIRDDAQQIIYFRNQRVEPSADYTFDAIYRLIEATGREHLGQAGGAPTPSSYNDQTRVRILLSASDGNALGRYLERYVYDAVGNFQEMVHRGSDPVSPGWTRAYDYSEASQLEPGKQSNRLTSSSLGPTTETYSIGGNGYDAHGSMLRMPQLQIMQWNFQDQLQMSQRQAVNAADEEGMQRQGERTWYVYGADGQRMRKVTELAAGQVREERIYLGSFESYRRQGVNPLVRETLHIMDGEQRIALVDTRTQGLDPSPQQLIRYQLGNHLGSVSLELDKEAQIISYEEYTPYGTTSYQAVRSQTETPKRYRYTDKERDEETGLSYHGARYYAGWLGRWTAADPIGLGDGPNVYTYVLDNPTKAHDPTGTQSKPQTPEQNVTWRTDADLKQYLSAMTPEQRGAFVNSVDGPALERVKASYKAYDLEVARIGVTTVEHVRPAPTPPPEPVISGSVSVGVSGAVASGSVNAATEYPWTGVDLTVVYGTDETTLFGDPLWDARATTINELDMTSTKNLVDNVLGAAGDEPISSLTIWSHGGPGHFQTGEGEAVTLNDLDEEPTELGLELARLRGHFTSNAIVELMSCNTGEDPKMVQALADTLGVPVVAYEGLISPLVGNFEAKPIIICRPQGTCEQAHGWEMGKMMF